ncbi:MAG: hypothetical protein Q9187_008869 [Circinaria calcarea]
MLSWLRELITGRPRSPSNATPQVARIPADGAAPHLIRLDLIDVLSDGNVDCCFSHIPDFRKYWGGGEGWRWREVICFTATDQASPGLNGMYFAFKSFAADVLPVSEHTGFCGDAFITKAPAREYQPGEFIEQYDEHGRVIYEDVSVDFLKSPLPKMVLERLHER